MKTPLKTPMTLITACWKVRHIRSSVWKHGLYFVGKINSCVLKGDSSLDVVEPLWNYIEYWKTLENTVPSTAVCWRYKTRRCVLMRCLLYWGDILVYHEAIPEDLLLLSNTLYCRVCDGAMAGGCGSFAAFDNSPVALPVSYLHRVIHSVSQSCSQFQVGPHWSTGRLCVPSRWWVRWHCSPGVPLLVALIYVKAACWSVFGRFCISIAGK